MAIKGAYVSRKKGAKKGTKKKVTDLFSKKEWFTLRIPSIFVKTNIGQTLATRSTSKQNIDKLILNRKFEVSQGDLTNTDAFRIFTFIISDVRSRDAICTFDGMRLTSDKIRSAVKRGQTLIEADMLVNTNDGYTLRVFVNALSKRTNVVSYIQQSKVKQIRQLIFDIIQENFDNCNIDECMEKMLHDTLGKEVESRASAISPLQNCMTIKIMVVRRPKYVRNEDEEEIAEVLYDNPNVVHLDENYQEDWGEEEEEEQTASSEEASQ